MKLMNERFEIIVPTLFGLENMVKKEIYRLGYDITKVEDGRVTFLGDYEAVCRANIWLRCGERVLIKIGEFKAETADELYEGTKKLNWHNFIDRDDAFPVKGKTIRSTLASDRNSQIIIKKAIADELGKKYGISWLSESGIIYQVQFTIINNIATLMIDTSGEGLHKRGYRAKSNLAPVRETIAAAMVALSYWKFEEPFLDPFCGSGTIPIEAAMFKRNIAPGINRKFAFMNFPQIEKQFIQDIQVEAFDTVHTDVDLDIYAQDIDKKALELTRQNAIKAGVKEFIHVSYGDARKISTDKSKGSIITNPPYGERLGAVKECKQLYHDMRYCFDRLDRWSYYILTSHDEFENEFGKRADRTRKIYNGSLRCRIFQYYGNKPKNKNK